MPTSSLAALHERQAYAQFIGPTVGMAVGGASAETNGLGGNPAPLAIDARYQLYCAETGIYVRQGGAGVVATAGDLYVPPKTPLVLNTADGANRLAQVSGQLLGGTLYVTRLDSIDGLVRGQGDAQAAAFVRRVFGSSQQVAVGGASARSTQLAAGGRYAIYCPVIDPIGALGQAGDDVWVKQGGSGVVVANSGANLGMPLPRGALFEFNAEVGADYMAVLSATGGNGSSVWITRIDAVA